MVPVDTCRNQTRCESKDNTVKASCTTGRHRSKCRLHHAAKAQSDINVQLDNSDTYSPWLTSAKNASILPTPPRRRAPGPAERRHRLRSPVRKSRQRKGERVCQDRGKVAVPLCWCFPFTERLCTSLKWLNSLKHTSAASGLYAQKEKPHEKNPEGL